MIHCDEVFDILTRGPFPTGAPSDGVVESHLVHCEACRQLAEALRPAVELFQEAVTPEESRTLPSYWGEVGPAYSPWAQRREPGGIDLVQRPAFLARRVRQRLPEWFSWQQSGPLAAAVLVGVLLAGLLQRYGFPGPSHDSLAAAKGETLSPAIVAAFHDRSERYAINWLATNPLPAACRDLTAAAPTRTLQLAVVGSAEPRASQTELAEVACCSGCHTPACSSKTLTSRALQQVSLVCGACH